MREIDRRCLVERHLISRELAAADGPRGVAIDAAQRTALMANEEDHVRLQVIFSGLQLEEAWRAADSADNRLEAEITYAFSPHLGYLTACPTNVGTGMRASVMLHLPGLVLTRQIEKVFRAVARMRLAVRGLYGEGTQATGDIYQISNQASLGRSEEDILKTLGAVIPQIIGYEQQARGVLADESPMALDDRIYRSWAILTHARTISSEETLMLLSAVRLGVHMGRLKGVDMGQVNELFLLTRPGHIQKSAGGELSEPDRDIARADVHPQTPRCRLTCPTFRSAPPWPSTSQTGMWTRRSPSSAGPASAASRSTATTRRASPPTTSARRSAAAGLVIDSLHGYFQLEEDSRPRVRPSSERRRAAAAGVARHHGRRGRVRPGPGLPRHHRPPRAAGRDRARAVPPRGLRGEPPHPGRHRPARRMCGILIENMPPPMFGRDVALVRRMVDEIASPHLGQCYDSGHAMLAHDPLGTIRAMGPRLWGVHLHDNDGQEDDHRLPGMGIVPFEDVARTLAEVQLCRHVHARDLPEDRGSAARPDARAPGVHRAPAAAGVGRLGQPSAQGEIMLTLIHRRVEAARAGTNSTVICRMPSGWAVLGDSQFLRGYSLLLADPVVPDLNSLDSQKRTQYLLDMAILGDALLEVTGAYRINYEILGNLDAALHAHVIPRYRTEPEDMRKGPACLYDKVLRTLVKFDCERDKELMKQIAAAVQRRL